MLPSLCLLSLPLSGPLTAPPTPPPHHQQVRASGAFALGTFINGCQDKSNDLALSINQEVGMNLLSLYQDPSPIVRKVSAERQWKRKGTTLYVCVCTYVRMHIRTSSSRRCSSLCVVSALLRVTPLSSPAFPLPSGGDCCPCSCD